MSICCRSDDLLHRLLGLVGTTLKIMRVIFLVHPVQCAQDVFGNPRLATKVAVGRMIRMIILDARRTNILPSDLFHLWGSRCGSSRFNLFHRFFSLQVADLLGHSSLLGLQFFK